MLVDVVLPAGHRFKLDSDLKLGDTPRTTDLWLSADLALSWGDIVFDPSKHPHGLHGHFINTYHAKLASPGDVVMTKSRKVFQVERITEKGVKVRTVDPDTGKLKGGYTVLGHETHIATIAKGKAVGSTHPIGDLTPGTFVTTTAGKRFMVSKHGKWTTVFPVDEFGQRTGNKHTVLPPHHVVKIWQPGDPTDKPPVPQPGKPTPTGKERDPAEIEADKIRVFFRDNPNADPERVGALVRQAAERISMEQDIRQRLDQAQVQEVQMRRELSRARGRVEPEEFNKLREAYTAHYDTIADLQRQQQKEERGEPILRVLRALRPGYGTGKLKLSAGELPPNILGQTPESFLPKEWIDYSNNDVGSAGRLILRRRAEAGDNPSVGDRVQWTDLYDVEHRGKILDKLTDPNLAGNGNYVILGDDGEVHMTPSVSLLQRNEVKPGPLRVVRSDDRSQYSHETVGGGGTLTLRPLRRGDHTTALHEVGHRMEYTVPGIMQAEAQQLAVRRGATEPLQKLRDLTGIQSYRDDEVAYEDEFASPYQGKVYPTQLDPDDNPLPAHELLTMGLQGVFYDYSGRFRQKDPRSYDWTLGVLATVGKPRSE